MSDPAPLIAGPIHGVRAWEVRRSERDGELLCGWAVNEIWPPNEPLRASCVATRFRRVPARGRRREPHLAPDPQCGCGIYALHPERLDARRELLDKLERAEGCGVIGVIEAWGRIEVHAQGFRAERARPVRFFRCGANGELGRAALERLACAYGAEIVELEDSFALPAAFAELQGLARGTVRRLLGERGELVLEPYRSVATDRAGRELVTTGFRPSTGTHDDEDAWTGKRRAPHLAFRVSGCRRAMLQREEVNLCRELDLELVHGQGGDIRVNVLSPSGELMGRVPAKLTGAVRRMFASPPGPRALVVAHTRLGANGPRRGLEVLVTPHQRIALLLGRPRRKVALETGERLF